MTRNEKIIGIVVSAILAIAAVFGYWFPIEVPEPPEKIVNKAIERVGLLDVDGRGITGWMGSDWTVYSDGGSTQKWALDGATGNIDSEGIIDQPIGTENLGVLPTIASANVITSSTGAIFTVADGEVWFVHACYANVTTNWDCTGDDCTLQIGDGNDANGLLDLVDAELQAADTEGTGAPAGWQGFMSTGVRGAYLAEGLGFIYAPSGAAETIDVTVGGTSPAAGAATIYLVYTRIQ